MGIRVILFGMTGFGNNAFSALLEMKDIELIAVFTPKRPERPFPHYECEQLHEVVLRHKDILLVEGMSLRSVEAFDLIRNLEPDLIVVSTFRQIIPQRVIDIPKKGIINIHPSLLPKYRGPTPTVWTLRNGERETGVTSHFIEDETIDTGRIIYQTRFRIASYDTDGELRAMLAHLSERVLDETIPLVFSRDRETFPKQDESLASYYSRAAHAT